MVRFIPNGMRGYLRWLKCCLKFPHVDIAQTALVATNCKFGNHVKIHPFAHISGSQIGRFTYIGDYTRLFYSDVGQFCSIASRVNIGGGVHPTNWVSTSPVFYSTRKQCGFTLAARTELEEHIKVSIGNDVWIGVGATVLPGIQVGDGAIIGAGSVVTKDVSPYSIIGGVPGKLIRYRFDEREISFLLKTKWWDKDLQWLKDNRSKFSDIKQFILENQ